jgi:hypothetical protein
MVVFSFAKQLQDGVKNCGHLHHCEFLSALSRVCLRKQEILVSIHRAHHRGERVVGREPYLGKTYSMLT